MTIALRSVSSVSDQTNSPVIPKPVGLSVGDLMIAHIVGTASLSGGVPSFTPPADWTEIRNDTYTAYKDFGASLFWKIADSDDVAATDFTFTHVAVGAYEGVISAWTGHDASVPINANNGQANASSTTVTSPTITPAANCVICLFCSSELNITTGSYAIATNNPGSWSEAYDIAVDDNKDATLALGYALRPETTATGNGTATISSAVINIGQLVAIAPAAVAAAGRSFGFIFG